MGAPQQYKSEGGSSATGESAGSVARRTQANEKNPDLIFQQDNARPHTASVAMNCLSACQRLPRARQIAMSLSDQACLGYDGKATASAKD
ncbi:hypothetical protein TNCV_3151511 [Trichonephila clavipes]|nr:hypothetical protein TNCV_3151511 [Trichonephila clavipes]